MNRDVLVNHTEFPIAMAELKALGLLEFKNDDEVTLSNKGVDYAFEMLKKHSITDRIAIMIFCRIAMEASDDGEDEDVSHE
jgi:Mn-dependent DtxR family transcriptional regulator